MTVPQRFSASKAILLLALPALSILASPAAAEDDARENPQPLFTCTTDEVDDAGFLNLNGVPQDDGSWTDLRFERHADGDGRLVYEFPPAGADSKAAFLFSHSDGPEGYLVSIRWVDQGQNYVYYSLAIPPDPAVEDDMGGGVAGLAISQGGTLVERAGCAERPYMFISYMREAMSCDLANPYGEAACREDAHERTEAIDIESIGIVP